jgi:hypothetical protein
MIYLDIGPRHSMRSNPIIRSSVWRDVPPAGEPLF